MMIENKALRRTLVILLWVVVYPILYLVQGFVGIGIQDALTGRGSGGIVGMVSLLAFWTSWVGTKALRKKILPKQIDAIKQRDGVI